MTRRIMLELAPDTTETHCGSCDFVSNIHGASPLCDNVALHDGGLRVLSAVTMQAKTIAVVRSLECRAAESRAARMVEIAPEDAARYIAWRSGFAPHPRNFDRLQPIDDALREHAQKAVTR